MAKALYATSLIILLIATYAIYCLGVKNQESGIWFNLFAELIGVIIGITYIQFLLNYMNKFKWKNTDKFIQKRVLNTINQTASTVRVICELRPAVHDLSPKQLENITINSITDATLTMIDNLSVDNITKYLKKLNVSEWSSLSTSLRTTSNSLSEIILLTQGNPKPSQIEQLLKIQDKIHTINSIYSSFGDLFGWDRTDLPVSDNLPENKLINLRDTYYEHSARYLTQIIKSMALLLKTIEHEYKLNDDE